MKSFNTVFAIIVVLSCLGFIAVLLTGERADAPSVGCTMEARICPDGSAVGRSGPNCEFSPCPGPAGGAESIVSDEVMARIAAKSDLITVAIPRPGESIASPLTLMGSARGTWFFEGSFPVTVVDWNGLIIGEGIATANGEWMTEDFVPFSAIVNFTVPTDTPYRRGTIILQKDNPSGLPEHDNALEIPVTF
jgi:hypothetical protein